MSCSGWARAPRRWRGSAAMRARRRAPTSMYWRKPMRRVIAVPALILLLASCHHEAAEHETEAAPPPSASAAVAPAASAATGVTIRRADGAQLLKITEQAGGEVVIDFVAADGTKGTLRGTTR